MRGAIIATVFAAPFVLVGCAGFLAPKPIDVMVKCPSVHTYTKAEQLQIAKEYSQLPQGSILKTVIMDYESQRDQLRACNGSTPKEK